jgi:glucose uptake protein GlcU
MKEHTLVKIIFGVVILAVLIVGSYMFARAQDDRQRSGECVTKQSTGSNGGAINNYGKDITICP